MPRSASGAQSRASAALAMVDLLLSNASARAHALGRLRGRPSDCSAMRLRSTSLEPP